MKLTLFVATVGLALASGTAAAASAAVARLPGGMTLEIVDQAVSCKGAPVAILLDKEGRKKDMTCAVEVTSEGVRTTFAGYGKPVFWHKSQFSTVDAASLD
ncbi:hypothetical protein [Caballeronia zhejiangensis]|uniref:hypothetical protein n=1 Tax=Caballeronia zhejiangensis TaxID=871203 RepID=UPI001268A851|nr:hypothetical protein [Caballeronia zhejiangensis]